MIHREPETTFHRARSVQRVQSLGLLHDQGMIHRELDTTLIHKSYFITLGMKKEPKKPQDRGSK